MSATFYPTDHLAPFRGREAALVARLGDPADAEAGAYLEASRAAAHHDETRRLIAALIDHKGPPEALYERLAPRADDEAPEGSELLQAERDVYENAWLAAIDTLLDPATDWPRMELVAYDTALAAGTLPPVLADRLRTH